MYLALVAIALGVPLASVLIKTLINRIRSYLVNGAITLVRLSACFKAASIVLVIGGLNAKPARKK